MDLSIRHDATLVKACSQGSSGRGGDSVRGSLAVEQVEAELEQGGLAAQQGGELGGLQSPSQRIVPSDPFGSAGNSDRPCAVTAHLLTIDLEGDHVASIDGVHLGARTDRRDHCIIDQRQQHGSSCGEAVDREDESSEMSMPQQLEACLATERRALDGIGVACITMLVRQGRQILHGGIVHREEAFRKGLSTPRSIEGRVPQAPALTAVTENPGQPESESVRWVETLVFGGVTSRPLHVGQVGLEPLGTSVVVS